MGAARRRILEHGKPKRKNPVFRRSTLQRVPTWPYAFGQKSDTRRETLAGKKGVCSQCANWTTVPSREQRRGKSQRVGRGPNSWDPEGGEKTSYPAKCTHPEITSDQKGEGTLKSG